MSSTIISSSSVDGNITSCELKEIMVGSNRNRFWKFTQKNEYLIYNQCTGEEVSRYEQVGASGLAVGAISLIIIFVVIVKILFD